MVIGAIAIGILIFALIILGNHISERCGDGFDFGAFIGSFTTILVVIEIGLISEIIGNPTQSALDVYRGNTELEITSVNGILTDTVVVFKKNWNIKEKEVKWKITK